MPAPVPENRLLAALPWDDFARLAPEMTEITFGPQALIYPAGGPMDFVYFPRSGLASAVVVVGDEGRVEVAVIGAEGMVGGAVSLGVTRSVERVFCQLSPYPCRRMPAPKFVAEMARGGPLRSAVLRYFSAALTVSAQQIACNALHSVAQRCARRLLVCHDAAGGDEFPLTHEFLAEAFGVRRASVSVVAAALQHSGVIHYKHGRVRVLNRVRLEAAACVCYAVIRAAAANAPA